MKFPVFRLPFLPAAGMAIFPFIFVKYTALKHNKQMINHELIHLRQQMELLVIPFYLIYVLNYLVNLVKYRNHDLAYRNIVFEREAYSNESDFSYLKKRRFSSWIKYFQS